jgi:hypothetical protein
VKRSVTGSPRTPTTAHRAHDVRMNPEKGDPRTFGRGDRVIVLAED